MPSATSKRLSPDALCESPGQPWLSGGLWLLWFGEIACGGPAWAQPQGAVSALSETMGRKYMKAVTDISFSDDVLQSEKVVLVDFWADWCGPCRKVEPLLEELSKEIGDRVEIVKLDIDANPEVTRAYQVMSVPTLTVFRAGRPVNSLVGARPKGDLLKLIESAF
jgi:thioredoxin 1